MAEKRDITPLGDKQGEECTGGHKKNSEEADSCEDASGFGAHGLPLLCHCFFWVFILLFVCWLLFWFESLMQSRLAVVVRMPSPTAPSLGDLVPRSPVGGYI